MLFAWSARIDLKARLKFETETKTTWILSRAHFIHLIFNYNLVGEPKE